MSLFEGSGAVCQQPLVVSIKFNATNLKAETSVQAASQNHRKSGSAHMHVKIGYILFITSHAFSLHVSRISELKTTT